MFKDIQSDAKFCSEVENQTKGNVMACEAAIKKIIKVYKKALDNPTLKDDILFRQIERNLENIFAGGKETQEILNMISAEREF